jgi:hypothetical protein
LATLAAAASPACEIVIGDSLPLFECNAEAGPAVCPVGMTCDATSHMCVVPVDASLDVKVESSPSDAMETSNGCRGLGCPCAGDSDCDSGVCLTNFAEGEKLYDEAGMHFFCSEPCCQSQDCPSDMVCFGTGLGGNYCVNPRLLGDRAIPLGTLGGGSACTNSTQCRSGMCASPGLCADTCCSTVNTASQCASGTVCAFLNFPGPGGSLDTNYTANCIPAPTVPLAGDGQPCSSNSSCTSNLCAGTQTDGPRCDGACRSNADCASGRQCSYVLPSSNNVVAACFPAVGTSGTGASCTLQTNTCSNGLCDSTVCTQVCFTSADCSSPLPNCILESLPVGQGGLVQAPVCTK